MADTRQATLILFNKPAGVICQFSGGATRPTLRTYLPQRDVYPAGRLDSDSEGLVVLTGDGALQQRIADPRWKRPKTYYVQVEGIAGESAVARLRAGVELREFRTAPASVRTVGEPGWVWPRDPPIRYRRHIPTSWLELIVTEGKNRQVRRMTAAVGLPTLRLIRYAIGEWTLEGLAPGEWRAIQLSDRPRRVKPASTPRAPQDRSTIRRRAR